MSTYTKDENIRFLHDKNISQTLGDDTPTTVNTVPSLNLLNEVNTNVRQYVDDAISNLDVETLAEENKLIRTISETDGKVSVTFSKVLSSDLDGQLKQTQISNLEDDLNSCYKKEGGLINGDVIVGNTLSVSGKTTIDDDVDVNNDATIRGNFIQGRGTSYTGDAVHSVIMGISASTNKDDVFLWNGKQNEAYTDHGRGTFNINAVSGVSGVFVGNQSLEKIVDDKREAARNQAEEYTNAVSSALSADYVSKISAAKSQSYNEALSDANGYTNGVSNLLSTDYVGKIATAKLQAYNEALSDANGYTNGVSNLLSTDYVSKISAAKTNAYNEALSDANAYTDRLDNTLSNVGMLVSADLGFDYDESTRLITLNVKDYAGHDHTFTIDSARFIKGRIVDHVNIIEIDGQQVLRIWWTVEEGGTGVYSDVPLTTLAQVYHQGEGITITLGEDGYIISVNDTIVNKNFLNGKIAEINNDIATVNDKANTNTAKITSLAEISANHEGRISTLETGLTTANTNIATNAANITDANSHISNLETYVTSLSAPNGQIQTLSNSIAANYQYTHNDLSNRISLDEEKINTVSAHAERLQNYANTLSGGNGQIATLSNAVDANTANIALAAGNIDAVSANVERLQDYANTLSSDGGTINTLSNDINKLSTSIINSDAFIGEIKVNYNNLTAGTAQAWVSQNGNTLSGVIKHFTLAPLGYVKQNTIIKVTYTNVPSNADRTKLATLKYVTDDGIAFTDNDYIIIHGDFDQIQLENITPNNVYYANAVKRCELFELSNAVYNNYAWLSGNSKANGHAISGLADFINDISVGESLSVNGNIVACTGFWLLDSFYANNNGIHLENKQIDGVLSGTSIQNAATYGQVSAVNDKVDKKIWIDDKISNTIPEHFSDLSIVKLTKADYETLAISSRLSGNVLYVVESNYIDTYGQEIRNVLSSTESTNAATYGQLTAALNNYYTKSETSSVQEINVELGYYCRNDALLDKIYPIGSIYTTTATGATCPIADTLGGTWELSGTITNVEGSMTMNCWERKS